MSSSSDERGPVELLADEFLARCKRGEKPTIKEYCDQHPALAAEIRDVFEAVLMVEDLRPGSDEGCGSLGGAAPAAGKRLQQVGDYRILCEIGRGGMGVVYEAEQQALGRRVALKVLPRASAGDGSAQIRFQREAKAAARMHHTNIVPVFDVGQDGEHLYYAMQLIHGQGLDLVIDDLKRLRARREATPEVGDRAADRSIAASLAAGTFERGNLAPAEETDPNATGAYEGSTPSTAVLPGQSDISAATTNRGVYYRSVAQIGVQAAAALSYAHSRGIIHRDIKPGNLILDTTGNVWVTDFGLAKTGDGGMTHTGDILGTVRYMSPERFRGQCDVRADVYALGMTLYEMLTLKAAYASGDRLKLIELIRQTEAASPRSSDGRIPRDLETIVMKAIDKDAKRRYQSADEMGEDLQRFVNDEPIKARRIGSVERLGRWCRRNPLPASLLAGMILVFLAGFAGVSWQWREAEAARDDEKSQRDRAERSQKETASALATVASQKTAVEHSLSKAEAAERLARAAVEEGRQLQYVTDMQLAPFVWKDDRTTTEQLRMLLARYIPGSSTTVAKPDLRGFEWYYNQHLLQASAAVFSVPDSPFVDGVFTADGKLLTMSSSCQLRRWNLDPQNEEETSRRDLRGGASVQAHVLSPDGRLAALAAGGKVHLFDTATGKETLSIDSAKEGVHLLTFSRDGNQLVVVDDKIRWCNSLTGEVIATFDRKLGYPRHVGLSSDGLTLAVVGYGFNNGQSSICRLDATAKKITLLKEFGIGTISGAALSPDGQRLVSSNWFGGDLAVHNVVTGREIGRIGAAHACRISAIAFSDDGTKLASADEHGTIKIWADAQSFALKSTALRTLKGHQGSINTVRFSLDGKRLFSSGWKRVWETMAVMDRTARVWDLENGATAFRQLKGSSRSGVARLSPDGLLIADADRRGIHLWDAATGRLVRDLPAAMGRVRSLAFSPTAHRLLAVGAESGGNDSHVALWDLDAGRELARLAGATDLPGFKLQFGTGAVGALAFSPDGQYLVAGFGGRIGFPSDRWNRSYPLKVWEVATRRPVHRLVGHTFCCSAIDFSRDGKLLASGSYDRSVVIWSTSTWTAIRTLAAASMVFSTAFSPDGKTLVAGNDRGSIQWWDAGSGQLLETVNGHAASVSALAFSPDGRTLASGSEDQTVRLWNVPTRRQFMQLDPGSVALGFVQSLDFSPDGKRLLATGTSSVGVWFAAVNK